MSENSLTKSSGRFLNCCVYLLLIVPASLSYRGIGFGVSTSWGNTQKSDWFGRYFSDTELTIKTCDSFRQIHMYEPCESQACLESATNDCSCIKIIGDVFGIKYGVCQCDRTSRCTQDQTDQWPSYVPNQRPDSTSSICRFHPGRNSRHRCPFNRRPYRPGQSLKPSYPSDNHPTPPPFQPRPPGRHQNRTRKPEYPQYLPKPTPEYPHVSPQSVPSRPQYPWAQTNTSRTQRNDTSSRFCTRYFEFAYYTACSLDTCNNPVNKYSCCKKGQRDIGPKVCVCHPDEPCERIKKTPAHAGGLYPGSTQHGTNPNSVPAGNPQNPQSTQRKPWPSTTPSSIPSDTTRPTFLPSDTIQPTFLPSDTTRPPSLCGDSSYRLLHGTRVEDPCKYMGIANITTEIEDEERVVCNAVLTVADVAGTTRLTFLTPQGCTALVDAVLLGETPGLRLDLQFGDQTIPVLNSTVTTVEGPDGNGFINVSPQYSDLLDNLGQCKAARCTYDESKMNGLVDTSDCRAVSWGASEASTYQTDGLHEVKLEEFPMGCQDQKVMFNATNTKCFRTVSNETAYCANDAGAPVYCMARRTGEWILMGVLAFQAACDRNAELTVIPFPQ